MDCTCEFTDAFFQLAGARWKLAKAIAIHESNLNPHATGDDGDAQGLFQMHRAFAEDLCRLGTPGLSPLYIELRGVPFVSIRIMAAFFAKVGTKAAEIDIIGIFHWGDKGWAGCASKESDSYVMAVLAILGKL
jgi:transglycosylase-like protein with SLT domain